MSDGAYTAFMFVSDDYAPADRIRGHLRCIQCGEVSVGIHRVVRLVRDDYTVVDRTLIDSQFLPSEMTLEGLEMNPDPRIRGDSLAIEFRCDLGHSWTIEFANHKSVTIASISSP